MNTTTIAFILAVIMAIVLISADAQVIALFIGIFLSVLVFLNAEIAYWIILVNVYLTSSLISAHFPFIGKKIIWITDLMLFVLALKLLADILSKRIDIFKYKINIMLFLLVLLSIVSAIVNGISLTVLSCGLRNYFKYVPLFFASIYYFDNEKLIKKSFTFWIIIGLINVPVALIQFFIYRNFDYVGGLFSTGGSGILTVYQFLMIGYLFIVAEYEKLSRWKAIGLSIFLFIPVIINQTKISFYLLPILLIYIYRNYFVKKPFKAAIMVLLFSFLFYLLTLIYTAIVPDFNANDLISPNWLSQYLYSDSYYCGIGSLNRFSSVTFAIDNISKNIIRFFIGTGVGNASFSNIPGGMGEYYARYFNLKIDMVFLSKILWEIGVIGTVLYFFIVFKLWRYSTYCLKRIKAIDQLILAKFFGLLVLFLTINIVYDSSFYFDEFACIFWMLGGYLTIQKEKIL